MSCRATQVFVTPAGQRSAAALGLKQDGRAIIIHASEPLIRTPHPKPHSLTSYLYRKHEPTTAQVLLDLQFT